MAVRHDEGVAIRIDPEPCADVRNRGREASVGERKASNSPTETIRILGADAVRRRRKATWTDASARASGQPGVVEEPGMCGSFLGWNREIPHVSPTAAKRVRSASGRRGAVADGTHGRGKSDSAIVAGKSVNKAEKSGRGTDGAKGRGQGERAPAKHVPGAEAGSVSQALEGHATSSKAKEVEGTVHLAPPPHQCRSSPASILRS